MNHNHQAFEEIFDKSSNEKGIHPKFWKILSKKQRICLFFRKVKKWHNKRRYDTWNNIASVTIVAMNNNFQQKQFSLNHANSVLLARNSSTFHFFKVKKELFYIEPIQGRYHKLLFAEDNFAWKAHNSTQKSLKAGQKRKNRFHKGQLKIMQIHKETCKNATSFQPTKREGTSFFDGNS